VQSTQGPDGSIDSCRLATTSTLDFILLLFDNSALSVHCNRVRVVSVSRIPLSVQMWPRSLAGCSCTCMGAAKLVLRGRFGEAAIVDLAAFDPQPVSKSSAVFQACHYAPTAFADAGLPRSILASLSPHNPPPRYRHHERSPDNTPSPLTS